MRRPDLRGITLNLTHPIEPVSEPITEPATPPAPDPTAAPEVQAAALRAYAEHWHGNVAVHARRVDYGTGAEWTVECRCGVEIAEEDGCPKRQQLLADAAAVEAGRGVPRHRRGVTMTTITNVTQVPTEDLRVLFDTVVGSMNFSSGFLDTDEVNALRCVAVLIGADPVDATPANFAAQYPHKARPYDNFPDCMHCRLPVDDQIHEQVAHTAVTKEADRG